MKYATHSRCLRASRGPKEDGGMNGLKSCSGMVMWENSARERAEGEHLHVSEVGPSSALYPYANIYS